MIAIKTCNFLSTLRLAIVFFVIIGVLFPGIVKAQDETINHESGSPEQIAELLTKGMDNLLSLDDNQLPVVAEINLKYARLSLPVLKSDSLKFIKARKLRKILSRKEDELEAVLSQEQFELYLEEKNEIIVLIEKAIAEKKGK